MPGMRGDGDGPVDDFEGRDADGAARSVDEFQSRRQQLVDAVAHQRVGLAAADFHEHPGAGDGGAISATSGVRQFRIAILVDEFHGAF